MDSKNPNHNNQNLSPEELFRMLDVEKGGQDLEGLNEFEREALEGLKMVKNREKVAELNQKIDALLEEEDRKKALIIPPKSNKGIYMLAMAASLALIIGFFFLFRSYSNKEANVAVKDDKSSDLHSSINKNTVSQEPVAPVNSDATVVEQKTPDTKSLEEKETLKPAEKEVGDQVVMGTGNTADYKKEFKAKDNQGTYNQVSEEETSKNRPVVAANTSTLVTDKLVKADDNRELLKEEQDNFSNNVTSNNNNSNTSNTAFEMSVAKQENAEKKKEEDAKQGFTYYNDLSGGLVNTGRNDSTSTFDLARNGALNSNQSPSMSNSFQSPAPNNATPTYHWSTTTGSTNTTSTFSKVTPKKKEKSKGSNRKARSAGGFEPGNYSSGKKSEETNKKTKADEGKDKDVVNVANAEVAQNIQDEKSVNDNELPVLATADIQPEYPGGNAELMKYLTKNINLKGATTTDSKVFVGITVNTDGSLKDIKILKGLADCASCRETVLNAFRSMPKWKPGMQDGKAVAVKMNIPVILELK